MSKPLGDLHEARIAMEKAGRDWVSSAQDDKSRLTEILADLHDRVSRIESAIGIER